MLIPVVLLASMTETGNKTSGTCVEAFARPVAAAFLLEQLAPVSPELPPDPEGPHAAVLGAVKVLPPAHQLHRLRWSNYLLTYPIVRA